MAKPLTALTKTAGLNAGSTMLADRISIDKIEIQDIFANLIPIKENDLIAISENMKENGFDTLHPVCIWKEKNVLVDGHTRRQAAIRAGLEEIYCFKKSFVNESEAIRYAINEQIRRRNLDDVGKIMLIEKLDNLKQKGRPTSETEENSKGKSAENLAATLGVGTRSVEKGRTILKDGDEETVEAVKTGEMSINKAYNKVQAEKKKAKIPEPTPVINSEDIEDDPFSIKESDFTESYEESFEEENTDVKAFVKQEISNTESSITGHPKIQLRAVQDTIRQFKAEKMTEYENDRDKYRFAMQLCDELISVFG